MMRQGAWLAAWRCARRLIVALPQSLLLVWLIGSAALWAAQDNFVFPAPLSPLEDPVTLGHPLFRLEELTTADGLRLAFWAAAPRPGMPTVIDFHGNASGASHGAFHLAPLARRGYGLVLAEYRGYSGNPGRPSELGLVEDARAYARWVSSEWGVERPVLLGESIGSGVAVALAAEVPTLGVALDSPFTSLPDVVDGGRFFWAPTFLLRHRFDSLARIPAIASPVTVLHGMRDPLIPASHGRALLDAARCPVAGAFLTNLGHLTLGADTTGEAMRHLIGFIDRLAPEGGCPRS